MGPRPVSGGGGMWRWGGIWPVGGVWSTGSAGAIGSDCGQVSAIRPNQEVCIYVSALPFSKKRERDGTTLDPTGKTSVQGTETLAAERARC